MRSSIKTGGYCFRTYRSCIIHCNAYEQMHGGHDRSLWRHASDLVHEFGLAERGDIASYSKFTEGAGKTSFQIDRDFKV